MATLHPMTRGLFRISSRNKAFGANFLGVRLPIDGGAMSVDEFSKTSIAVTLPWPEWLCRTDKQVDLAAALAIQDEVSTFGMCTWDKLHRPGVSVTLSAQRAASAEIAAGEPITFASRLIKGGHSLAWIHLEVLKADGTLLMTGRHLKFQPAGMPPGWETLWKLPFIRPFAYSYLSKWTDGFPTSDSASLPPADASRQENLSMEVIDRFASTDALHNRYLSDGMAITFKASLSKQYGNPGSMLHGGCSSLLLEEAASASYCMARGVETPPAAQRLSISLPGAIDLKKPKTIELTAATSASEDRAHAVLGLPGKGAAVEADVWW